MEARPWPAVAVALLLAVFFLGPWPQALGAEKGFRVEPSRGQAVLPPGEGQGRYAVVVGVARYRNQSYNLMYADRDAQAFYDFLRSPEGGAYSAANIVLLLNEQATASALRSALGTFLAAAAEPDYVTIFFSGHGESARSNPDDLYLLTHEADLADLAGTAFPMDEVRRYLEKSVKARRVVMIVDACRSGGVKLMGRRNDEEALKSLHNYLNRLSQSRPGLVSLTASGASQSSEEGSQYGGGHGAFTHLLLKGLDEEAPLADLNRDQVVDVAEAYEYVREKVKKATNGRQIPDKTGDLMVGLPLAAVKKDQQAIRVVMGLFRERKGEAPVKVNPGDSLRSGDGYYFLLEADQPCHLYLFQVDAGGAVFRLFPEARYHTGKNPIRAGSRLVLPNPREVYFLDQTVGPEEVYLFASREPIPELEGLESGRKADLAQDGLKLMGPAGVRPV
ncbi:MAG: caspase family protein, partial [Thermodesulfobacteriota bacterium]